MAHNWARTESIHFDSRIDSFWIKNHNKILIREVNQKNFFLIFDSIEQIILFYSDSFWFTFEANESQWFILIRFDFDSSRIMIHLRIEIESNQKSKRVNHDSWFTPF